MAEDWRTPDAEALFDAILRLETLDEAERFFRDLCTLNELRDMAQRWAVVAAARRRASTTPRSRARPARARRRSPASPRG